MEIKKYVTKWLSFTILRKSTDEVKCIFRNLERIQEKIVKTKCHLSFNETCVINKLLPTYTNIKTHDDAARRETFVNEFRLKLVERQIQEQKQAIAALQEEYDGKWRTFREILNSDLKCNAFQLFLERMRLKTFNQTAEIHRKKLVRLYGGPILLKQNHDSVINLSNIQLDQETQDIFSLGMNCHLKQRFDKTKKKVEIEMMYENIKEMQKSKKLVISDDNALKSELERFGMKNIRDNTRDLLTKEQYKKVKDFNNIDSIVTRKADKSNTFVILDKEFYQNEINQLLSDESKFKKIPRDPTEEMKKEINKHISFVNNNSKSVKLHKLEGKYKPGYIYGNPKIHKRLINPPLRPIISQIGTITYELSKHLNSIIVPFMPRKYTVQSSYEFVSLLKDIRPDGHLASLDVESLFTNVPVQETIEIILKNVYHHPTLPPPDIPASSLKALLTICTTKTPFQDLNGDLYVQCEGVSMGSALGPTFADFYMCNLENKVFQEQPDLKPIMYVRYVDDCFLVVDSIQTLFNLKQKFEAESVLKFTYEKEKSGQLAYLDSLVRRSDHAFKTSVFIKSTNLGDCLNYNSICPEKYKTGVIKTFLHRGFAICSDWATFHTEIERIKQILTNNNYPMKLIDETVKNFLNSKFRDINQTPRKNKVQIFYEGQMCCNYKIEEKQLTNIIDKHVQPIDENHKIKLQIYYRNKKLKNLFIKNKGRDGNDVRDQHHVVYQYTCNQSGCNSSQSYIGYTSCTIDDRFRMHAQSGSIKKHLMEHHKMKRITKNDLIASTRVLRACNSRSKLRMTEAILIKEFKPQLNSQDEGCDRLLKIFKH